MSSNTLINRRCLNLKNKKYRRFNADIWSRLAIKRRYNFITRLIADSARISMSIKLRRLSKKTRRRIWAKFKRKKKAYTTKKIYISNRYVGYKKISSKIFP